MRILRLTFPHYFLLVKNGYWGNLDKRSKNIFFVKHPEKRDNEIIQLYSRDV